MLFRCWFWAEQSICRLVQLTVFASGGNTGTMWVGGPGVVRCGETVPPADAFGLGSVISFDKTISVPGVYRVRSQYVVDHPQSGLLCEECAF